TGPFEFIYNNNNRTVSGPIEVSLTPAADLQVSAISLPSLLPVTPEGSTIDMSWTVHNVGGGTARGTWTDRVYLEASGVPNAPRIEVGAFTRTGPLAAGTFYTRS